MRGKEEKKSPVFISWEPASPPHQPQRSCLINIIWWWCSSSQQHIFPCHFFLAAHNHWQWSCTHTHTHTRTWVFLASYCKVFGKLKIPAPATCKDHLAGHRNAACLEIAAVQQSRAMPQRSAGRTLKTNDLAGGSAGAILSSWNIYKEQITEAEQWERDFRLLPLPKEFWILSWPKMPKTWNRQI